MNSEGIREISAGRVLRTPAAAKAERAIGLLEGVRGQEQTTGEFRSTAPTKF
jgi:hypothetical protein